MWICSFAPVFLFSWFLCGTANEWNWIFNIETLIYHTSSLVPNRIQTYTMHSIFKFQFSRNELNSHFICHICNIIITIITYHRHSSNHHNVLWLIYFRCCNMMNHIIVIYSMLTKAVEHFIWNWILSFVIFLIFKINKRNRIQIPDRIKILLPASCRKRRTNALLLTVLPFLLFCTRNSWHKLLPFTIHVRFTWMKVYGLDLLLFP